MEWIPVSYKHYSELTGYKSFAKEAKAGRPIMGHSGKILSDVEAEEYINVNENRINEKTQWLDDFEKTNMIKYKLHKWLFVAGLAILIISRAMNLYFSHKLPV